MSCDLHSGADQLQYTARKALHSKVLRAVCVRIIRVVVAAEGPVFAFFQKKSPFFRTAYR